MKKTYTLLLGLIVFATLPAQLITTINNNGVVLAQSIVNVGVTITNVQLTCPNGASGFFICDSCSLNMPAGVALTTGSVGMVEGPNNAGSQGIDDTAAGNSLLNTIAGAQTHDACVLEFDMQMLSDSVELQYVFGSEEYPEWVNSGYNDVFAFFISGPGIAGQKNIAIVPGTTIPVTIDNVNSNTNSQYFVNNGTGLDSIHNTNNYYIQYDGFTTVLTAKVKNIQPFAVYHLKLAVADAGDGIYDSGVFLETNSLSSNGIVLQNPIAQRISNDSTTAYTNCDNTGMVQFHLLKSLTVPTPVRFVIGGDAVNGIDYEWINDTITIAAGDTVFILSIIPKHDSVYTTNKTVVIYLPNNYSGIPYDSFTVILSQDSFSFSAGNNALVCNQTPAQLSASAAESYLWTPVNGLSEMDVYNPIATPTQTTTYYCSAIIGQCAVIDSVTVEVRNLDADFVKTEATLLSYQFTSTSNIGSHLWSFGDDSSSTEQSPLHTYLADGVYIVTHTVTDAGCIATDLDTVTITISSVTELKAESITLSPNPVRNELTISRSQFATDKTTLSVFDITGRRIIAIQPSTAITKLQTINWLPGIYFVEVRSSNGTVVKKLIKE